jgi:hypothetical protein
LVGPQVLFKFQQKTHHLFFQPALPGADLLDFGLHCAPGRSFPFDQIKQLLSFLGQLPPAFHDPAPMLGQQAP